MRTIKLIILGLILLVVVVLSLANRGVVTLNLLPEGMAGLLPMSVEVPLFVVCLLSVVLGMVIGYLLEWLREHKHRRHASRKTREAARLNAEVDRLRKQSGKPDDDVLAIIGS
jgi:lipopolysaccharide assembly protein A